MSFWPFKKREHKTKTDPKFAGASSEDGNPTTKTGFNRVNPRSIEYAQNHAAESVPNVSQAVRAQIQELVTRAFTEGIPPKRLGSYIAPLLLPNDAEIMEIARHRNDLITKGYKAERLDKSMQRFTGKLLRNRAEMIARTEILRASNEGQLSLWQEAVRDGLLDPDRTSRVWIATIGDDVTCELCLKMHERTARLARQFDTPLGRMWGPPLHEGCRCCMGLRFDRD